MTKQNYSLKEYQDVGNEFYNKLRLLTYPLAIKYFKNESEIPQNALRPSKIKQKLSLCQAFTLSRRWNRTVAMTFEDNHCITSSFVQGWAKMSGKQILKSQILSKYHANPNAELKIQLQFAELMNEKAMEKVKGNLGCIISPLPSTEVIPDVILVYGNPAQITHIIHALSYEAKYLVNNQHFMGYGESCIRGVLVPYISNKAQVVLPGTGDRMLAMTMENEMALGMPAKRIFYVTKFLFKSAANYNMGMPSKFMLIDMPEGMGPPAFRYLKRQYKKFQRRKKKISPSTQ